MATVVDNYALSCDACVKMFRDKSPTGSPFSSRQGYLTSSCSDGSFEQCLSVEPKVTMKSVLKATAAALSTKHQTLPSIQDCISPKIFPISSALFGCNLEEAIFSFNSISSNDDRRLDVSWQGFLKDLDIAAFTEERQEDEPRASSSKESLSPLSPEASSSGITPVITPEGRSILEDIMFQTLSDVVMATQDEIKFEETLRTSKETATPMRGRKHAGQKKEKKTHRLQPYSRKTVPVEIAEDQESPRASSEAPFNFTVLPSIEDVPGDEVSSRRPALSAEDRKKLESQFMEFSGPESSSSGGSGRGKVKWLTHTAASPETVRRKQAHVKSLDDVVHKARRESIHKVAGVHDGSRKRRAKSERWIRV